METEYTVVKYISESTGKMATFACLPDVNIEATINYNGQVFTRDEDQAPCTVSSSCAFGAPIGNGVYLLIEN